MKTNLTPKQRGFPGRGNKDGSGGNPWMPLRNFRQLSAMVLLSGTVAWMSCAGLAQANLACRLSSPISASEDIAIHVSKEFGAGAAVADWMDIREDYAREVAKFYEETGLADGARAFVIAKGERFYDGDLQYFVVRSESGPPAGEILDHFDTLYLRCERKLDLPVVASITYRLSVPIIDSDEDIPKWLAKTYGVGAVMVDWNEIKANFAPGENPALTLQTQGQGTVQVSPNPGSGGRYIYGTLVTLTPRPAKGYLFAGWSGDFAGADNPASVVMDGDKTLVATFVATPPGTVTSDDFDACTLNTSLWTFIKGAAGDGSYTTNGQELLLRAPAGISHNIWLDGNRSVRVMQPTSNNDFEIVVKYNSSVTKRFQMQGILIEQDSNDFLRFEAHHDGAHVNIYAAKFVSGDPTPLIHVQLDGITPPYLRVTRTGDQWSFSHSMDGQTWLSAGSFTHKMTVASSGVFSANHAAGGPSPEHIAIVDYFFNTAAPIDPEDNDTNAIKLTVNGQGTVTRNPNKTDYACGETVTLTATPAQGWVFKNWSGALSGSEPSKTLQVNGTINVTAVFAPAGGYNEKNYFPVVIR